MTTREELEAFAEGLAALETLWKKRMYYRFYPDEDMKQPDGSYIHARRKYQKHMEFFEAGAKYRERCAMAANRVGKALRNGTPVATPGGWVPIEDLSVGDVVFAGDGTPTRVTGVFPQGRLQLYSLLFDGVHEIECCADHLWLYKHPRSRYPHRQSHGRREENPFYGQWSVGPTSEIIEAVGTNPTTRMRVVMPSTGPWQMKKRKLPIDPYVMGVLLGDGHFGKEAVTLSSADDEILDHVRRKLPEGMTLTHISRYDYRLKKGAGKTNHIMSMLRNMGLLGTLGHEKFVPEDYMLSSINDRLDLLRGLMDSDGSITKSGAMEFSSTSRKLADAVAFLVTSLGGRSTIEERQTSCSGEKGRVSWRVRIRINTCPFRLKRKAERWNPRRNTADRILHSIKRSVVDHATCISVDHPDRTYVTKHGIVTHNTLGMGGYELSAHLTGRYPKWWKGRRFKMPIRAWAAGQTNETTRDIVQSTLLGDIVSSGPAKAVSGTGIIPGDLLGGVTWKAGIPDLVDTIQVAHVSGGWSILGLKSYQQGRKSFEGTAQHVIWLDEEPPLDVYGECVIRTATTGGLVMLTFTPLGGLSDTVMQFLPKGMDGA